MNELLRVLDDMKKGPAKQSTFKDFEKDFSRVQSPSSINTYFDCPRKYFYKYIKGLPTKPSIYLLRGKIVHSVLEDFFALDPHKLSEAGFDMEMKVVMVEDFSKRWKEAEGQINALGLPKEEQNAFFLESKRMVGNFVEHFSDRIKSLLSKHPFHHAFKLHTPQREIHMKSDSHKVQGYIDALYTDEKTRIIDYKTSASDEMREEYKRQLAIYSLMYFEKFKKLPDEVGVHFLLFGEKTLPATMEMTEAAAKDISFVHKRTSSGRIQDYPKGGRPLCKWSRGECDFFRGCGGV